MLLPLTRFQDAMPFDISDFQRAPLVSGRFVKPLRVDYVQNGHPCSWEVVQCHDSVAVLLYHRDKDALLLVKQFRPAVYLNHPQHLCTYELCAGLVDKDIPLPQIVREEIDEECGFAVPVENIRKISSFFTHVGISGNQQHLFFAMIDDTMHIHAGGGVQSEQILLEYVPLAAANAFIYDESKAKTPGLMFAFSWFLANRELALTPG